VDPDPGIFVTDHQDANKKQNFKILKNLKAVEIKVFLTIFLGDKRIRIRIHTSDLWTRIQEAQKHVDPDPQHWGILVFIKPPMHQ
jgi:hypothetical protein